MVLDISKKVEEARSQVDEMDEDIALLKHLTGPDATFNWLVEDFTQKKADSASWIYSPPFYSHPNGYQMRLEMHPNGFRSGKASHISLGLAIMRGPNDHKLAWPYSGKYQLSAIRNDGEKFVKGKIDPSAEGDAQYWGKPCDESNKSYGWPQFIEHSKLPEYIKNDKMVISVTILD